MDVDDMWDDEEDMAMHGGKRRPVAPLPRLDDVQPAKDVPLEQLGDVEATARELVWLIGVAFWPDDPQFVTGMKAAATIRAQAAEIERLKADRNEWKRQYDFLVDEFNDAVDEAVRRESTPPSQGSPQSDRPA